jgi:hypothetical protein
VKLDFMSMEERCPACTGPMTLAADREHAGRYYVRCRDNDCATRRLGDDGWIEIPGMESTLVSIPRVCDPQRILFHQEIGLP